jgi:hypothetical protein
MDQGHARRDAGDHKAAMMLFQGADAIMHVPTTGLELAREQVALGQLVEARDSLQRVIRMPSTDGEPEAFRLARTSAASLDDDLARRIPALRILVSSAPDGAPAQVAVDGVTVPLAALVAPFRVNPGHHVVTASAGNATAHRDVDVKDGQTIDVTLGFAPPVKTEPSPIGVGQAGAVDANRGAIDGDRAAEKVDTANATRQWLRWGGLGLVAVGAGVGTVTGIMSISSTNSASQGCVNSNCPPPTWSDIDNARTTATISTIAFCAAGAGAVLAVTSFFIRGSETPPTASAKASARTEVTPWFAGNVGGVSGTF